MRNVICIKWGTLYGADYVNKLNAMVRRHLSGDVRFICVTEDATGIDAGVEIRPLPAMNIGDVGFTTGWRKLSIFSSELADITGPILFLDLDVIVVDSLDPFFEHEPGRFCIIENWTQMGQNVGQSSVFRYERDRCEPILKRYEAEHEAITRRWTNEQMYLTDAASPVVFWPEEWCRSFKHHLLKDAGKDREPAPPAGARIIIFHGAPNPPEAALGWWKRPNKIGSRPLERPFKKLRNWLFPIQRIQPATWIDKHWR